MDHLILSIVRIAVVIYQCLFTYNVICQSKTLKGSFCAITRTIDLKYWLQTKVIAGFQPYSGAKIDAQFTLSVLEATERIAGKENIFQGHSVMTEPFP